jgi:hypothetical protein
MNLIIFFSDNYTKLCTVEVDLSQAILTIPKDTGEGNLYEVFIDFILLFGMTELKAQVAWTENVSNLHMLFNPNRYSD